MHLLTNILLTAITLDQSYFNFTVGAAFIAGAIVIICVTLSKLTKNRKTQERMLDELEKRINVRRRILNDTRANTWRSTGKEIEFTDDFAIQNGILKRMPLEEFAKYIHQESQESWKMLQEYHDTLGRKNIRLLIKTPKDGKWHWFKVSFNSSGEDAHFAYNGIFTCIDDEIKKNEKARKLQNILKQQQQEFYLMYESIPAMKRLMAQIFENTDTILKSDYAQKADEMKEANIQLHKSAESFRRLTHSLAAIKNHS